MRRALRREGSQVIIVAAIFASQGVCPAVVELSQPAAADLLSYRVVDILLVSLFGSVAQSLQPVQPWSQTGYTDGIGSKHVFHRLMTVDAGWKEIDIMFATNRPAGR